jgi:hypothetical protein
MYTGEWMGGLPHGYGMYVSKDKYEGTFSNGLKFGFGEEEFGNGDKYVGMSYAIQESTSTVWRKATESTSGLTAASTKETSSREFDMDTEYGRTKRKFIKAVIGWIKRKVSVFING